MIEAGFDGRTSAIAHGSMRILDGAGVWQGMAHAAEPIRDIRVADGGSPLFLHYDPAEVGGSLLGYIVENRVIRRALFEHLAGPRSEEHTSALPSLMRISYAVLCLKKQQ